MKLENEKLIPEGAEPEIVENEKMKEKHDNKYLSDADYSNKGKKKGDK
jgi:hypothetical protein